MRIYTDLMWVPFQISVFHQFLAQCLTLHSTCIVSVTIGLAQLRSVKELSYTRFDKHGTFFLKSVLKYVEAKMIPGKFCI